MNVTKINNTANLGKSKCSLQKYTVIACESTKINVVTIYFRTEFSRVQSVYARCMPSSALGSLYSLDIHCTVQPETLTVFNVVVWSRTADIEIDTHRLLKGSHIFVYTTMYTHMHWCI